MIYFLLLALALIPAALSAQERIDWASFPVEREIFVSTETDLGRYSSAGTFDGVGMLYFSPSKRTVEIRGLKTIRVPYLGQEADDKYEFHQETFTLTSVIRTGDAEYAFQAINDGPFARTTTGKMRVMVLPGRLAGRVDEFLMEEHGQAIKGVMNRYVLPRSAAAKAVLKTYGEVFFGGNWVALDPER